MRLTRDMALLQRSRRLEPTAARPVPAPSTRQTDNSAGGPPASRLAAGRRARVLPPSVARVAARTRLSAEILAAVLELEERSRPTLDDMERADALAARLIARRREQLRCVEAEAEAEAGTGARGPWLPMSA